MEKLTPMMAQYKAIKEKYPDTILMFRLGDFYEMFFEDALTASKILQITLTSRSKNENVKVPMCGVPYHALDNYLYKLTKVGKKVAICDQMTAPDGKGIVEREVTRVVTPGTTFDEHILENKSNNYVAAAVRGNQEFAFAYCDVTTGDFLATEFKNLSELENEIGRIKPAEIIGDSEFAILKNEDVCFFDYEYFGEPELDLKKHFDVHSLASFGFEKHNTAVQASAMLLSYLKDTQKAELKHIQKITHYSLAEFMPIDETLIRNLELFFTARDGKREGSLIGVIDQTMNPMGGRLMRNWLLNPLLSRGKIEERLGMVGVFVSDSPLLREIRNLIGDIYDLERLISKLSVGTGNARDLLAIKNSLEIIPKIKNLIKENEKLIGISGELSELEELKMLIDKAILEEAPLSVRDGGMIKSGFNAELDALKNISKEGKNFLQELQKREIERTGISSMKVKFNKVFGYYLEISNSNLSAVPSDYIRKQTLVNAERYITPELKEYEEKVLNAEERIVALEYEIFYAVKIEVIKEIVNLQKTAKALAKLDAICSFAFSAVKNDYCRPVLSDEYEMKIVDGRHPVIEQIAAGRDYVPNDCVFENERNFLLVTGPNMGGKSTYLRQVALIVLMAQIGSYVPAKSAKISLVDRIFTRVGAGDNLAKGESTFMVEMQEAAYILNQATSKSLIILDEIGRGTSTYDGLSIAWAIMEYLHDFVSAKTLFATHYHELIELADRLLKAINVSVAVRETEKEGVVFLYKVVDGAVDKSYGIEVAKLAGLPIDVIGRARGVLNELETKHIHNRGVAKEQMPMFEDREHGEIIREIKNLDLENITPLQAIQKLYDIKKKSN